MPENKLLFKEMMSSNKFGYQILELSESENEDIETSIFKTEIPSVKIKNNETEITETKFYLMEGTKTAEILFEKIAKKYTAYQSLINMYAISDFRIIAQFTLFNYFVSLNFDKTDYSIANKPFMATLTSKSQIIGIKVY